jgi:hypothetical protein
VSGQLLQAADHEADLLGHPYIGLEHLDLGRLHLAGRTTERDALRQRMRVGVPRRWWRPRGPNSALGRRGRDQTKAARLSAERDERSDDVTAPGNRFAYALLPLFDALVEPSCGKGPPSVKRPPESPARPSVGR